MCSSRTSTDFRASHRHTTVVYMNRYTRCQAISLPYNSTALVVIQYNRVKDNCNRQMKTIEDIAIIDDFKNTISS